MTASPSSQSRCPKCGRAYRRTHPQNRLYWALLTRLSERHRPGGQQFGPETWHVWAKRQWLASTDLRLPDGKIVTIEPSTTDLTVDAFTAYLQQLEVWCAERGIYLDGDLA